MSPTAPDNPPRNPSGKFPPVQREREAPEAPEAPGTESGATPPEFRCDLCGGFMLDRHCKLLCLRCGYQRDCSDP